MTRPIDVVRKVAPHAKPGYLAAIEQGSALFLAQDITTPLRLAHFLAQALHETGGLTIEWESGNYSAQRLSEIFGWNPVKQKWNHSAHVTDAEAQKLAHNGPAIFERVYGLGNPAKAHELGNTEPGDGYRYRGGGVLQTTGRGNYRRMGQKCGVDFEAKPELVISAEHALKPALAEWGEGNLNAKADGNDILAITKKINGGTNGLAEREAWLRKVRPLIDTVDLFPAVVRPDAPALPPAPPQPKTSDAVKHGGAGAIIVAGGTAAATAHQSGAPWGVIIGIAVATVALAGLAWVLIHAVQKQGN